MTTYFISNIKAPLVVCMSAAWEMAKMLLLIFTALLMNLMFYSCFSATVYTVGENSGWDISTDLDSWAKDKTFSVGDTLLFQYSQYHSVGEVSKENYKGCNTTNVIQSSSNGNTSFALTRPGERFFVCGNKLHCLGGMKLHVNVVGHEVSSPGTAPQPQPQPGATLPPGSSKSDNPAPSSSFLIRVTFESHLLPAFLLILFA